MTTNVGKKTFAHKGSAHGIVAPPCASLVTPPAPPAPAPFPYIGRAKKASGTNPKINVGGNEVLVDGSTIPLERPANQPSLSGGGDIVTHATTQIATMTTSSILVVAGGDGICATGDIAALNVLVKTSKVAQVSMPLLEGVDFDMARQSYAAAAAMNRLYRRAYPPTRACQTLAGHPVDLGTGYVVDGAVDLELPGHFPLVWSRSYSSAAPSHAGALGKGGWTHSFEQWIEITEDGFRLHDEEGLPVDIGPLGDDGTSFHRGRRLELSRSGRSIEVRSLADRRTRTFSPLPGGRLALRTVMDARGHRVSLEYQSDTLVRVTDTVKREIRLTNDEQGRVVRVEVWAGEPGSERPAALRTWFDYAYHPEGELASHTNALGHAEGWEYDGLHRMTKATLRSGVAFHYEYHPELGHCCRTWGDGGLHDVRIEMDLEKGETCTHGTNRARRYLWKKGIVHREETFGGEWSVERLYDDDELLVARKNGAGEETLFEHDARGNLVKETDAAGNVTAWEYIGDLPSTRVDRLGLVTTYDHDHHGSLVAVTFPTGVAFRADLDRDGRPGALHDAHGLRARLEHDEHGNVVAVTSPRGAVTSYRYDALGRAVEQTDAIGRKWSVEYDARGRQTRLVRPDGAREEMAYDRFGNLASLTDALGQTTRLEYIGTGSLARAVQPDGQVYRFAYDSDERLVQIVNPRLEKYEFEYDRADQIVAERTFDGRTITYRRDRAGRIVRVDGPEGEWRELAWDPLGNLLEDRGADVRVAFTRDALGRAEKAVCQDVTGKVTTEIERDRFGRVSADIQNGRAVRYEHDSRGRLSAREISDGQRTEYHYDIDDRFAGVSHGEARVSIERDALGRERTRRFAQADSAEQAGWKIESDYDRMDRLASQRASAAGPGAIRALVERRYSYDSKGRLASVDSPPGGLATYRHDSLDQLVEASIGGPRRVFDVDVTGSVIGALDELSGAPPRASWSVAPGNRLRATGSARLVNDGCGRRIQRTERIDGKDPREHAPRNDDRVTTYGWDTLDRLREVVLPDGSRVRFTYDAAGRRVRKDVLGPPPSLEALLSGPKGRGSVPEQKSVLYLWDGDVLCEEQHVSRQGITKTRIHVHEVGSFVPLLQIEDGVTFGVVCGVNGAPSELIDMAGRVVWRARLGAYGDVLDVSRDSGAPEVESPFRLLGQYHDGEVDLCHTKFRYFDASTGRWLAPDPLGIFGGMNLFAFDGSPLLRQDPLGLCSNDGSVDFVGGRRVHILNRHKFGKNISGKTEFPKNWSDDQIMHAASDVHTDPNSARGTGKYGEPFQLGIRDGVVVHVDEYPPTKPDGTPHANAGKVSTAYPTNTPVNP